MDSSIALWSQETFYIHGYGLTMILALCLVSVWSGSLLLGVARRSERFFMAVNGAVMITWLLLSLMTVGITGSDAFQNILFIRLYLFHLLFSNWFLMTTQLTTTSERFRVTMGMIVLFDLLVVVFGVTSLNHNLLIITPGENPITHPVVLFLLFLNIGKLFAGTMSMLSTWRFRKWSRQVFLILIQLIFMGLIIVRMNNTDFFQQQLIGVLLLFTYLFLLEISFRSAPTVMNTLSGLIFERMDRLAFILSESGRPSYVSAGVTHYSDFIIDLELEEIIQALGAGWQRLDRGLEKIYQWRSYDLHGGYLVYFEDIKDRVDALQRRDQQLEELHMKKDLLLQRGAMNRELEQFQMRLNILSNIEESISDWLRELAQKIEELDEGNITDAEVEEVRLLCAYIRRRSNLAVAELQENPIESSVLRQWCEEIMQMGKNQVHLEVPRSIHFRYPAARSILSFFLQLARLTSQLELWIYGIVREEGSIALTLSGEDDEELMKRLESNTSPGWSIREEDGEVSLDVKLEVPHV